MTKFEFLTVLFSIIIGLALTHLLNGLGRAFYTRHSNRMDAVHVAWTLTTFLILVLNWWVMMLWEEFDAWNFPTFLLMVLWVTSFYAMAVALYPARLPENVSYRILFEDNRSWFLVTFSGMCLLDISVTAIRDDGMPDLVFLVFVGHLAMVGIAGVLIRRRWYDYAAAYWVGLMLLAWSFEVRFIL